MGTHPSETVIATEQKAVDHAYACYGARLAEMNGHSAASASASGKDGIANKQQAEESAAEYDGLGDQALVISRVDAPEDPGGQPRPWYIGRRVVRDETNELVVIAWTSPLATTWSKVLPEAPGEVVLRRRLRCARHVVESYLDEIGPTAPGTSAPGRAQPAVTDTDTDTDADSDADARTAAPEDGTVTPHPAEETTEAPAPRDGKPPSARPGGVAGAAGVRRRKPPVLDDFLLRELQRARGGHMRDIVETIRRDQMDLVTGSPSDILVVQGGPGTGKSAVGLHRVTWLVDNGHFTAQDILVIGPHQRFLAYVEQVLPTLGTRDVNAVQLDRLWEANVLGTDPERARRVKSDERMATVLRHRVESDCRPDALDSLTVEPSYEGDEAAVVVTAGSTTLRIGRSEVLALLDSARGADGPYRQRRDRFRSLFVDRLLRELLTVSPRRGRDGTIRRDLERNRRVERLIDRLWPSPSPREALRSLYDSPELLRTCADGLLDDEEQTVLHRPRGTTADADSWTVDDHVCLEELEFLITGQTPRRYGHIVVDEAQDLTPMQARALRRRLAVNGSMTVLGDLAQATGPHTHTSWDRIGALLSDHGDWRTAGLDRSYRVPAEIMDFVAPLARAVAPDLPSPQAVRVAGEDAVRTVATEPWKLLDDTLAEVTRLLGTSDGSSLRSVAVIVPDDSGWLGEIGRHLERSPAVTGALADALSVLPAGQAKGLEYDHVLVVEPATVADRGPAGLRQLYIALTRSTQSLTVLHTSPLPQALTDTGSVPAAAAEPDGSGTAAPEVLGIGTDIRVRVTGTAPGGRYKVEPLSPVTSRPLVLTVRHGSTPPRRGAELDCWVFANETNHSVLTADQRGRQPVSPKMAERYVRALGVLDELVRGDAGMAADARRRLSELQGMANRVLRRDQADWVDVRRLLGSPDRERLEKLRDIAASTSRALKDDTLDIDDLRQRFDAAGWATPLLAAREALRARLTGPAEPLEQPEQKEHEPVKTADEATVTPAQAEPAPERADGLLPELTSAAATDRTCKKHEAVRHALKSTLLYKDIQPEDSPFVDVMCVTGSGRHLYEVLGNGRSSHQDLRSGAARLLEINHTLPEPADRLYLVLCEPPSDPWSASTVRDVLGVRVVWHSPEGWEGEYEKDVLGSTGS